MYLYVYYQLIFDSSQVNWLLIEKLLYIDLNRRNVLIEGHQFRLHYNVVLKYNIKSNKTLHVRMGSCINGKQGEVISPNEFKSDQKMGDNVYKPLTSTLYNALRKRSDIEIVRNPNIEVPMFFGDIVFQINKLKPNDMKMLFNFKNVLLVQPDSIIIDHVRKSCSPKTIYSITKESAKQFLDKFPIFGAKEQKLQARLIPIMVFNQQQMVRSKSSRMIFLHSQKFKNQELYKRLKVNKVVTEQNQVKANIRSNESLRILYLHHANVKQQKLLETMNQIVEGEFGIGSNGAKKYFENVFPQTKTLEKFNQFKSENILKVDETKATLTENFQFHFQKLYQQMGSDQSAAVKVDRAYNLMVSLISNIYTNKQSQNFRKVRQTNKQIDDLLGKYKHGVKLLQDIGFTAESGFYVNNMDARYLKLYRTDLDLAYKNYLTRKVL